MSSETTAVGRGAQHPARCAQHPARPAHDQCPRCQRLRCDADVAAYGPACCAACRLEARPGPTRRLEVAVRAGLASLPVVLIGGWIATQYVEAHVFSLVVPGLVGVAASWAAGAAVTNRAGSARWIALAVACVAAVLGTALGFRLVPGGRQGIVHPLSVVGAPYLCAVLGAVIWPLLIGSPRRRASRPAA